MVLSNAERQKRFRERLKAAARGDDLPERVTARIEEALALVLVIAARENVGGYEDTPDLVSLKARFSDPKFQKANGSAFELIRQTISGWEDEAKPDEIEVLNRALAVLDAAVLKLSPQIARPLPVLFG